MPSVAPPHLDVASTIGCDRDVAQGDAEACGDNSVPGFVVRNCFEKPRERAATSFGVEKGADCAEASARQGGEPGGVCEQLSQGVALEGRRKQVSSDLAPP